jgi:hypothetical protein
MHVVSSLRQFTGAKAAAPERAPEFSVSFPDLVRIHYAWRRAVEEAPKRALEDQYRAALAAFEREHGRVVNAYWCFDEQSAVALTLRRDRSWIRPFNPEIMRFHRVSDWATKNSPRVAGLLHQCDEVAIKATEVLRGTTQRICMQLVMASAGHLLSLVDGKAAHETPQRRTEALELQRKELTAARKYFREAATGEAQIVYGMGMLAGIAALIVTALIVGGWTTAAGIDSTPFFGCMTAGAIGALVSVMSRITSGSFSLDYDVGRNYTLFLGGLRPLVGSIFGVALYFAVDSGLLEIFAVPKEDPQKLFFLLVIAFLAGFSERWAQDTLVSSKAPLPPTARPAPRPPAQERPPDDGNRDGLP